MAKILLVEDNTMIAECYLAWLGRAGHKIIHVQTAQTAFDALDAENFDLIMLDLLLPGTNGLQLLHLLPSHADWAEIPVIICSSVPPDAPQISAYGVRAILNKATLSRKLLCVKVGEVLNETVQS